MQLLKGWEKNGYENHLFTCSGREGFLSNITGVIEHHYWYKLARNPYKRLLFLIISQAILFVKLIFWLRSTDIIYVNTVLPFGAAIAGKVRGVKVYYHIHETSLKPLIYKKLMFFFVKLTASKIIYVSKYLADKEPIPNIEKHILYNAIPEEFVVSAQKNLKLNRTYDRALMVCSLKDYKGIREFIQLALDNGNYNFRLVLNATENDVIVYFKELEIPSNLKLFSTQKDLHPHYYWADVILNLSRPDIWIETFGLTIIEGMAYGLPAIIPPVGGITELVEDKINGIYVDSRVREALNEALNQILGNRRLYKNMTKYALTKINQFTEAHFTQLSLSIL
jgi:glycosyltransferase involved in cell wall biosynthesis